MNERIRELAMQTDRECEHLGQSDIGEDWVAKFAELIVRECANFIEPLGDYCGGHGEPREPSTRDCAEKLKQHLDRKSTRLNSSH